MAFLFKVSCVHATIFFLLISVTLARPGNFEEFGVAPHEDKCKLGDLTVIEVCQRCAKQTKSSIVYPMCCENEDDAYNWCDQYINYGKKS
ncbi:uncharacterized protein LOC123004637 [Tribolium madens]|uniref:uncharacterized protein LOC123004637 n=1 Tax=Tribolium madens TaxID=41895 RepID=UPI001CF737C0|nr:uncharacterized protein LOC123004637 [Tribolium madens]